MNAFIHCCEFCVPNRWWLLKSDVSSNSVHYHAMYNQNDDNASGWTETSTQNITYKFFWFWEWWQTVTALTGNFFWMELSLSLCLYFTRIPPVMAVMAITHWSDRKSNKTEDCTTILSHHWTVWSICSGTHTHTLLLTQKKDQKIHSRR